MGRPKPRSCRAKSRHLDGWMMSRLRSTRTDVGWDRSRATMGLKSRSAGCQLRTLSVGGMKIIALLPLALLAASPVLAVPVVEADGTIVHRLSDADKAAIIAKSREHASDVDALPDDDLPNSARQVHGEVGFGIGTGGYREVYGTVVAPLGDDAVLALSFDQMSGNQRYGARRFGPGRGGPHR
jgi:hypothetical protein